MLEKLKAKMFPCTEIINKAIADNCEATSRLIKACSTNNKFPPIKDRHIVNPR